MENRFQNLDRAALLISALTGLIAILILGFAFWLSPSVNKVLLVLLGGMLIGLLSFAFSRYAIRQFVANKVKLIFKTIHDTKRGTDKEEDQIARKSSLSKVEADVKEWAKQRKSEIQELKVREEFRREFIGNVSHELKTPIFNIQGYILTLVDGGLEDSEINLKYLKRAAKSVDRLINIVQDMDTLNKLESGVLEVKKRPFSIVELVNDVLDSLEDYAKKADIKVKLVNHKKFEKTKVLADPNRIEQVLINLVTNSIKYSKTKGFVDISFFDLEDRILVEVADNGVGISEGDLARIFERFYRVDKSRTRDAGGSGLGLAIVKHIMDSHQESINVQSSLGVGSTFSFTLKKAK